MIRRHREILSIIFNTDGFITGNELAKRCEVSVRTIQSDIKEINNLLKEYNTKINSVIKKGYCLEEESRKLLKKNDIIRSVLDNEYISESPTSPLERQMYIISKLTIKDYISVDELEDNLYVSVSTINKDIISVKNWLKENLNIDINYTLSKGIYLNVTESEKRNIISWILSYKLNASTLAKQWNYIFDEKEIYTEASRLYFIIDEISKSHGYFLSGHSSQLLCIEIIVAIKRSQLGFYIEETNRATEDLKSVVIDLKEKIHSFLNVNLSNIEWLNIQQFFMSKQFLSGTDIKNIETKESKIIVNIFLEKLELKYNIDLTACETLNHSLVLYLSPMINRLKLRHCIGNKIISNIENIHPYEYKMALEITDVIKCKLDLYITITELSYITLYLVTINKLWSTKLRTIIVCDYDQSVISYIKERVENYLGNKIKVSGCFTYQQFIFSSKNDFEDVDFIISTSTLADKTDIPFIQLNPIIEQMDLINLEDHIDNIMGINKDD
ncbi:MAG: transcription antiterminator [Clostridiaceae bacterium]